jgi:hypothetical protein
MTILVVPCSAHARQGIWQAGTKSLFRFQVYNTPCNNNPGVCVKGADPAVLTGREANGRNPTALLG